MSLASTFDAVLAQRRLENSSDTARMASSCRDLEHLNTYVVYVHIYIYIYIYIYSYEYEKVYK